MRFQSVRIITSDIRRLVSFYETALSVKANWFTDDFVEIPSDRATLAIGSAKTLGLFGGAAVAQPEANRSAILEFRVANVDAEFDRLKPQLPNVVQPPTTMPWGNRSLLFRDPDGNLVNFFTPVSDDAVKKFGE